MLRGVASRTLPAGRSAARSSTESVFEMSSLKYLRPARVAERSGRRCNGQVGDVTASKKRSSLGLCVLDGLDLVRNPDRIQTSSG